MSELRDFQTDYFDQLFERDDLSHETLDSKEFTDCVFRHCTFRETFFKSCRFINCRFEHCDLSLCRVAFCSFTDVQFEHSRLIGVNWTEATWSKRPLAPPLAFSECAISYSIFIGLDLPGVAIASCVAREVDFRDANLAGADLSRTDLAESLFIGTNLSGADLSHASNYAINPRENKVAGARFSLPDAIALLAGLGIELVD